MNLQQVLSQEGPFPEEALFLGIAEDEMPVLLDTSDPSCQAILIYGDGSEALLQTVYQAAILQHPQSQVVTIGVPFAVENARVSCYETLADAAEMIESMETYIRNMGTAIGHPLRLLLVGRSANSLSADRATLERFLYIVQRGSKLNFWTFLATAIPNPVIKTVIQSLGNGTFAMKEGDNDLVFKSDYNV